jgi:hypothetical protein
MNAISQTRLEPITLRNGVVHSPKGQAGAWWRAGCDFAVEAWEALAGVFGMPLRHPPEDRSLDRLDDHLLGDIGYERRKGPRLDSYF